MKTMTNQKPVEVKPEAVSVDVDELQTQAEEPQDNNIDFTINPETIAVEKNKTATFTITGDVDSIVSESLATGVFTVVDKTVTGVAKGTGKLKITAKKTGKTDTAKQFDVNVSEPPAEKTPLEILQARKFGKFKK